MGTEDLARSGDARRIIDLVGRGVATSRSQLAESLGLAPSTVGLRVQALLEVGLLREEGAGVSRGGRRPRVLRVDDAGGEVLSVEIGGAHARIGRHSLTGTLLHAQTFPVRLADGPRPVLSAVIDRLHATAADHPVRAVGVSLPGPVDTATGAVDQPSRMPGWPGFPVGGHLSSALGVPTFVDNDANLAALGEHRARFGSTGHSITVKAGTAIGSGIIVDGRIHRGATAAAGDISHTRIDGAAAVPCSCGNVGCLETVASGAGLVRQLRERGIDAAHTEDVLRRARDADPAATSLVRMAGTHLGQVLSGVVNFFNPHAVFLTGSLSAAEPFLAAVRSRVYEACHPLVTQTLTIEAAQTGPDAVLLGAARLAIDELPVTATV